MGETWKNSTKVWNSLFRHVDFCFCTFRNIVEQFVVAALTSRPRGNLPGGTGAIFLGWAKASLITFTYQSRSYLSSRVSMSSAFKCSKYLFKHFWFLKIPPPLSSKCLQSHAWTRIQHQLNRQTADDYLKLQYFWHATVYM